VDGECLIELLGEKLRRYARRVSQPAVIRHLRAASSMRPFTMPQGTTNGFFVHWI
jgi:hypothetical protein